MVSREIRRILNERAVGFNIALDDVSITNLTFGREFTAAIEAKQVAAQEAERAKFVVEKAEQDKRSAIIRAQVLFFFKNAFKLFASCSWENHLTAATTDIINGQFLTVVKMTKIEKDQTQHLCACAIVVLQIIVYFPQSVSDMVFL